MRIRLKVKEFKPKVFVSNDVGIRIVLEGIEGADYSNEVAELMKVMYSGSYVDLETELKDEPQ